MAKSDIANNALAAESPDQAIADEETKDTLQEESSAGTADAHTWRSTALRALIVAGTLLAAIMLFGVLVRPKNNSASAGMHEFVANGFLGEPENTLDVVFLGDSEALDAITPLTMWGESGFTAYTSATIAQRLCNSDTLLHRITKTQQPRVVVFETDAIFWSFDLDRVVLSAMQEAFPAIEYHDRWKTLTAADFTWDVNYTYRDAMKGFQCRWELTPTDPGDYMAPNPNTAHEEIRPLNRFYLYKLFDYCRSIGATPVLVSVPSSTNWNADRHDTVAAFAEEAGVDYLDLNVEDVGIDWSLDTHDGGDHLNIAGALKVSNYLANYLSEHYDLPDHRSDPAYADWAESYEWYVGETVLPDNLLPQE